MKWPCIPQASYPSVSAQHLKISLPACTTKLNYYQQSEALLKYIPEFSCLHEWEGIKDIL